MYRNPPGLLKHYPELPAREKTFPVGTRLVMRNNPSQAAEILKFLRDGIEDEFEMDPHLMADAYHIRFFGVFQPNDTTEDAKMVCYELHDEKEWIRMGSEKGSKNCDACGVGASKTRRLRVCASCRAARYCSENCQRAKWREHKPLCLLARKMHVSGDVLDAASRAKQERIAPEETAEEPSGAEDVTEGGKPVYVLTGLGIIGDTWYSEIRKEVSCCREVKCHKLNILVEGDRRMIQTIASKDAARAIVLLGVGGNHDREFQGIVARDDPMRAALKQFVRRGGTFVVHGEGPSLKTVLLDWFEQKWGAGDQVRQDGDIKVYSPEKSDPIPWSGRQRHSFSSLEPWPPTAPRKSVSGVGLRGVPSDNQVCRYSYYGCETPLAAGRFGDGIVVFCGDVDPGMDMTECIARICAFAGVDD